MVMVHAVQRGQFMVLEQTLEPVLESVFMEVQMA